MKNKILYAFLAICFSCVAAAQSPGIAYGPWITAVGETGCTILWTSECDALSWLELAPAQPATQTAQPATQPAAQPAATEQEGPEYKRYYEVVAGRRLTSSFHSVRIEGLEAGRNYRYRICGCNLVDISNPYVLKYDEPAVWTEEASFRTYSRKAEKCRFSMVNDMHFMFEKYHDLTCSLKPEETDFLFLNGDIVTYVQSADSTVKYCIGPIEGISSSIPVFFARGNHETKGRDSFCMKDIFPSTTGELYYCFRQGPAFFIVLDNGGKTPNDDPGYSGDADYDNYRQKQTEWLRDVLASPEYADAPIHVALIHMPPLGPDKVSYVQRWMSVQWVPMLNDAGLDLMLCAHQHKYHLYEPGLFGNNFPIYVNSNVDRMDVELSIDKDSSNKKRIFVTCN